MVEAGRWWWGWVMVSRQLKIKRKHWLKHPKAVPQKTEFGPKYRCYWKYYFWHTTFTLIHMFQRTSSKFFVLISDFLEQCLKTKKKLLIKITHFTIQVCSKHLTHFTNLNSFDIENNMLPKHCQKYFWLYFSRNMFLFGVRKNIWTAPFLETQELNSWRTLKANACIFLCI